MEQGRWQELRKLLDQALDLDASDRLVFANQVEDAELRADLIRMLARQDHTTPLDRPAAVLAAEAIVTPSERDWDREQIGRRVGAFVLDELLGAGGMGTVYRAHRVDGRLQQTVAVKLVLSAHPGLRERFRKAGGGALQDYELIELLLFAAIPRRDVKPLAKALIQRFGTYADALSATREELGKLRGKVFGIRVWSEFQ